MSDHGDIDKAIKDAEEVAMRQWRGTFPSGRPFALVLPEDMTPEEAAGLGIDIIRGTFVKSKPPASRILVPDPKISLPKRPS